MSSSYHMQQAQAYDAQASQLDTEIVNLSIKIEEQDSAIISYAAYKTAYNDEVYQWESNAAKLAEFNEVEVLSYRVAELHSTALRRVRFFAMADGCDVIDAQMRRELERHWQQLSDLKATRANVQGLAAQSWACYESAKAEEERAAAAAAAAAAANART